MPESSAAAQQRALSHRSPPPPTLPAASLTDEDSHSFAKTEEHKQEALNPFTCSQCNKTYLKEDRLRIYQRNRHADEERFDCNLCGKTFGYLKDRKRHESLHNGTMEYVCGGTLLSGDYWGCGIHFEHVDSFARHLIANWGCIMPLLQDEFAIAKEHLRLYTIFKSGGNMPKPFPVSLLGKYPALAGAELNVLLNDSPAVEGIYSKQSQPSTTNDGRLYEVVTEMEAGRLHMSDIHGMQRLVLEEGPDAAAMPKRSIPSQQNIVFRFLRTTDPNQSKEKAEMREKRKHVMRDFLRKERQKSLETRDIRAEDAIEVGKRRRTESAARRPRKSTNLTTRIGIFSGEKIYPLDKLQEPISANEPRESRTLRVSSHSADVEEWPLGHSLCEEKPEPLDQTRQSMRQSSETGEMLTPSRAAVALYDEARGALQDLRLGIEELSDGPETDLETSQSDLELLSEVIFPSHADDGRSSPAPFEDEQENTGGDQEQVSQSRATLDSSQQTSLSQPSNNQSNHKRSRINDTSDDSTRTAVGSSDKRTKLSCKRFICCFHDGPGRKCSGTDETISEVIKKLSEQHETHVCDRCWQLKIKDEASSHFLHLNDESQCSDYCLSPQCHKTSPSIGNRHLFDPDVCKRKTSRVRPGDSEAVFRYIFRMVHPELEIPAEVTTDDHALHLDAKPRQGRRKLTREELTARADELEKRLDEGERQNIALNARVLELQQALAVTQEAISKEKEKSLGLEKHMRRIVAMLSDALRTGTYKDIAGHQSLLSRVEEDAPSALEFQSRFVLTPPGSIESQKSSCTPAGSGADVVASASVCDRPLGPFAGHIISTMAEKPSAIRIEAADHFVPETNSLDQELRNLFELDFPASNIDGPSLYMRPDDPYDLNCEAGPYVIDQGVQKA